MASQSLITPERLGFALDSLKPTDGFTFEQFANAFLAPEFPDLVPVAGLHDGGVDAFLHRSKGQPDVFFQHSVTADWKKKIRATLRTLRDNGHVVRELFYCTNRDVIRETSALVSEFRALGITLHIRDRTWFTTFLFTENGRTECSELLARRIVDPIVGAAVGPRRATELTDEEQRVAVTYLQFEIADHSDKGLTKLCFEALCTYALREHASDVPLKRRDVHVRVQKLASGADEHRVATLVDAALKRLEDAGRVKHHTKEDAFALSHQYMKIFSTQMEECLRINSTVHREIEAELVKFSDSIGIDYEFSHEAVASDCLTVAEDVVCDGGRLAALALVGRGAFHARLKDTSEACREMYRSGALKSSQHLSEEQVLDLVPPVVLTIISAPSELCARHLRDSADGFALLFMLQQTADVQKALQKVLGNVDLILDGSVLLPAMSELLVPNAEKRFTRLLNAAHEFGTRLHVTEDVLNELETHIDRMRHIARKGLLTASTSNPTKASPILYQGYLRAKEAGTFKDSFAAFLDHFCGQNDPRNDLLEFLSLTYRVQFLELTSPDREDFNQRLQEVYEPWMAAKPRRPWVDQQAFETLVLHDARAMLLVEHRRRQAGNGVPSAQGHPWWWLVNDGTAFRMDRQRNAGVSSVCMSPEFFARYLSLLPKPGGTRAMRELVPVCVQIAGMKLVPPELREQAGELYEQSLGLPDYLRRRKLRELLNQARAMNRGVMAGAVSSTQLDTPEVPDWIEVPEPEG